MKSQIKLGAVLGYVNMIVNILITVFYIPIMLRFMGQQEYGLYALVSSIIAYLSVLDMGFGNAMVRFVSKSQAQKDTKKEKQINGLFLFLYTVIGFIALVIGIVLLMNIERFFSYSLTIEELYKAKIIMGILIVTVALSFPLSIFDSYVMAREKFVFLKLLNIIKTISIPLTMLPVLFMGYKSIAMVIVTSLYNILFHLGTLIYCLKKLKMKIKFSLRNFDKSLLKSIISYSFFVFLNIIVDNIFNNTDPIILGSVCGTVAVSVYAVASKFSVMNTTFSTTISGLFLPKITKMLEEENADREISDLFIKVSRIQIFLMILILSGFIIYGKSFISLWVGNEYLDAYYIIILLIGPSVIPLTQNIGISIIQAKNKHQFRAAIYIIIACLNVAISIPLARLYQGIGAAIGTAIANLLGQILIMNIFYWKVIKIDIPQYWKMLIKFLMPISFIAIINFILIQRLQITWLKLIWSVSIYTIVYVIIVYTYMNKEEKVYMKNIIKKILRKA